MKKQERIVNYPYDLLDEIMNCYSDVNRLGSIARSMVFDYKQIVENFDANWEYLKKTLPPREERVIEAYFKEGLTFEKIAKEFGVTRERIRQIEAKAIKRLSHPTRVNVLIMNIENLNEKDSLKEKIEQEILYLRKKLWNITNNSEVFVEESREELLLDIDIEIIDLSLRSYNCLKRAEINTIRDLTKMSVNDLLKVRNLGKKCVEEIQNKLNEMGYHLKDQEEDEIYGKIL